MTQEQVLNHMEKVINVKYIKDRCEIVNLQITAGCEACTIDQPSQWAHMEENGCLDNSSKKYNSDDELEDNQILL